MIKHFTNDMKAMLLQTETMPCHDNEKSVVESSLLPLVCLVLLSDSAVKHKTGSHLASACGKLTKMKLMDYIFRSESQ